MNTSKNVGELSSLTFLLQMIKGNYEPEHSQNTSVCQPNCNSTSKLFKVARLLERKLSQKNYYVDLQIKLTFKQIFFK